LDKAPIIIARSTFGVTSSSTESKLKSIIKYVIIERTSYRFGPLTVTSDTSFYLSQGDEPNSSLPRCVFSFSFNVSAPIGMYVLPSKKLIS